MTAAGASPSRTFGSGHQHRHPRPTIPRTPRMRNVKQGDRISGRSPNRSDRECFHPAPSPVTIRIDARRSGVNCRVEHARHRGLQPAGDPSGDVAGGPPRDMQETAHGPLAGDRHQPCAPGFEVAGEPAARLGPRHPGDHHAVRTAFHSRDRAGKPDTEATEVLVPPASPAPAVVVSRGLSPAARDARHAGGRQARGRQAALNGLTPVEFRDRNPCGTDRQL